MRARTSRTHYRRSGLIVLPFLALSASALAAASGTLTVAPGITLSYPSNWSAAPSGYANALRIVNLSADALTSPAVHDAVRILITTETRLDHADAVERLGQIGAELRGAATFLAICGRPGDPEQLDEA